MSVTKKTIILFSLYLLTALVMLLSFRAAESEPLKDESALSRAPYAIDGWEGRDVEITNANDFFILTDTSLFNYILRRYSRDDNSPEILLSALEDLKGTQRDIHDPRLCYESRGWTVLSYDTSIIESSGQDFGTMKVISYTDEKYNIKRFEIFGYISNEKIITNETSLRLAHIKNRVVNTMTRYAAKDSKTVL